MNPTGLPLPCQQHGNKIEDIRTTQASHGEKLDSILGRLDTLNGSVARHESRLGCLEQKQAAEQVFHITSAENRQRRSVWEDDMETRMRVQEQINERHQGSTSSTASLLNTALLVLMLLITAWGAISQHRSIPPAPAGHVEAAK